MSPPKAWRITSAAILAIMTSLTVAAPAASAPGCVVQSSYLTASLDQVEAGRPVLLSWGVWLGSNCEGAYLTINNQRVESFGQQVVRSAQTQQYQLVLHQLFTTTRHLRTTQVTAYRTNGAILTRLAEGGLMRLSGIRNGVIASEALPATADPNQQALASADFDRDGNEDILWMAPATGEIFVWLMRDGERLGVQARGTIEAGTTFQGIADLSGDRRADIIWRDALGVLRTWYDGYGPAKPIGYLPGQDNTPDPNWQVFGIGQFNNDIYTDILWRHTNGQVAIWFMRGPERIGEAYPGGQDPTLAWKITDVADFDGDGWDDILWRHTGGALAIWFKGSDSGAAFPAYGNQPGSNAGPEWTIVAASDFNFDRKADILWRHTNGFFAIWMLNGGQYLYDTGITLIEPRWGFHTVVRSVAVG